MEPDVYFKKVIDFTYFRKKLQFRVSHDLFSSFQIDVGTQFLIRNIAPEGVVKYRKILDLGCGYGPLGITLKALQPDCELHMTDIDALALEYTRQNAALNSFPDIKVYGSGDYQKVVERNFDLITSNIPAKAGAPVITHLLEHAFYYLATEGEVAVVVVNPLAESVKGVLEKNPSIYILDEKSRAGHTVFKYRFNKYHDNAPIPEKNPYLRDTREFTPEELTYQLETAYGLAEFDQLSYTTGLLLAGLKKIGGVKFEDALVLNPGIGHTAVGVWKLLTPKRITLADRNLLSLEFSAKNLVLNNFNPENLVTRHTSGVDGLEKNEFDLITGTLRDEEGPDVLWDHFRKIAGIIKPSGTIAMAGGSTPVTRIVERLPKVHDLKIMERTKYRGFSLLLLKKN